MIVCSQKWCDFLLFTLKFSTNFDGFLYYSQLNCTRVEVNKIKAYSLKNSLLLITKYSTILNENALFSTMHIKFSTDFDRILYCLGLYFLLFLTWFHFHVAIHGFLRLAKKGDKAVARRAQIHFIDRDCFRP